MKRIKLNLMFVAVMVGAIGAFAFKPARTTTRVGTSYYWFTPTGTPSYLDENDISDEQTATGCEATNTLCERGYTSSQLVNPSNPSDGVKSGQVGTYQGIYKN